MKDIISFIEFRSLNELLKIGKEQEGSFVIQFDKFLYVLDPNPSKDIINEIKTKISDLGFKLSSNESTLDSLLKTIKSNVYDIFIGKIFENKLYCLNSYSFDRSSIKISKIMKQLNIDEYVIPKDFTSFEEINKSYLTGTIPTIGFHGTSLTNLDSILKSGLKPTPSKRWKLNLKNFIFFSISKTQPLIHAISISKLEKSIPIIVEFTIPDKNKLVQDFDMEMFTGKQDVYDIVGKRFTINQKPLALSKEFGIFAYNGTIKPVNIQAIWVPDSDIETNTFTSFTDFVRLDKMKVKLYIKNANYNERIKE